MDKLICKKCGKDIMRIGGNSEDLICVECINKEFKEHKKERRIKRGVLRELNNMYNQIVK